MMYKNIHTCNFFHQHNKINGAVAFTCGRWKNGEYAKDVADCGSSVGNMHHEHT